MQNFGRKVSDKQYRFEWNNNIKTDICHMKCETSVWTQLGQE
jgi:hypothetical protein